VQSCRRSEAHLRSPIRLAPIPCDRGTVKPACQRVMPLQNAGTKPSNARDSHREPASGPRRGLLRRTRSGTCSEGATVTQPRIFDDASWNGRTVGLQSPLYCEARPCSLFGGIDATDTRLPLPSKTASLREHPLAPFRIGRIYSQSSRLSARDCAAPGR
jgi:hypothetical protein